MEYFTFEYKSEHEHEDGTGSTRIEMKLNGEPLRDEVIEVFQQFLESVGYVAPLQLTHDKED